VSPAKCKGRKREETRRQWARDREDFAFVYVLFFSGNVVRRKVGFFQLLYSFPQSKPPPASSLAPPHPARGRETLTVVLVVPFLQAQSQQRYPARASVIPTAAYVAKTPPTRPDCARALSASGATRVIPHQLQGIYPPPSWGRWHISTRLCVRSCRWIGSLVCLSPYRLTACPSSDFFPISPFLCSLEIFYLRAFSKKRLWVDIPKNTLSPSILASSALTAFPHLAHWPLARFSPLYCRPCW